MYIVIIGSGKTGSYLAHLLQEEHNVVVIDKDEYALSLLGSDFNGLALNGDGLDLEILKEAGIEKADALVVTTTDDNTNIIIAQIAKKVFNLTRVVARVSNVSKAEVYRRLGLDTVNSTAIFATLLREKIAYKNFATYLFETDKLIVLEILVEEQFAGKKVADMNIEGDFRVATILRKQEPVIAHDRFILERGDLVIGVAKTSSLKKVRKVLNMK